MSKVRKKGLNINKFFLFCRHALLHLTPPLTLGSAHQAEGCIYRSAVQQEAQSSWRESQWRRGSPDLPSHLLTFSSSHLLTSSPPHLITSSPSHLLTSSPHHLITSSPHHLLTFSSSQRRPPGDPHVHQATSTSIRRPPHPSGDLHIHQATSTSIRRPPGDLHVHQATSTSIRRPPRPPGDVHVHQATSTSTRRPPRWSTNHDMSSALGSSGWWSDRRPNWRYSVEPAFRFKLFKLFTVVLFCTLIFSRADDWNLFSWVLFLSPRCILCQFYGLMRVKWSSIDPSRNFKSSM